MFNRAPHHPHSAIPKKGFPQFTLGYTVNSKVRYDVLMISKLMFLHVYRFLYISIRFHTFLVISIHFYTFLYGPLLMTTALQHFSLLPWPSVLSRWPWRVDPWSWLTTACAASMSLTRWRKATEPPSTRPRIFWDRWDSQNGRPHMAEKWPLENRPDIYIYIYTL